VLATVSQSLAFAELALRDLLESRPDGSAPPPRLQLVPPEGLLLPHAKPDPPPGRVDPPG